MTGTVLNPLAGQDGQPAVLNEAIGNSFAMDQSGGVYIVSTQALYRYQSVGGTPTVTWRTTYDNTNTVKPGQKTPRITSYNVCYTKLLRSSPTSR